MNAKAQSQQYLRPVEETALSDFLLQRSGLSDPMRIKHLPELAFRATRHRPPSERPSKPLGKNWARAFQKRHLELQAKRVRALDWNRHDKNIREKVVQWFKMIAKVI